MKRLGSILFGLALAALPLLAQEAEKAGEKPDLLLWKWLNFAILAGILGYLAAKNVGPLLVTRSKQIQDGLAAGEKAKAEADARAANVQKKLANLETEIAAMRTEARKEREREGERIRKSAEAEIARIHYQAEQEIESAGKLARLEVRRAAARAAVDLAQKKVQSRMSPELQAELFAGFVADLGKGAVPPAPRN